MDAIYQFDLSIFHWFEDHLWSKFLDGFMGLISFLGEDGVLFIGLIIVLCVFKKTRKIGVTMATSLLLMEIANNLVLKPIIHRPRPFLYEGYTDFNYPNLGFFGRVPDSYSFPSGHTASAFTCATAMFMNNKKGSIPMYIFAVLMGISRIYLHDHYPTDVIGGAVLGILYGLLGYLIGKLLYEKVFPAIEMKIKEMRAKKKEA